MICALLQAINLRPCKEIALVNTRSASTGNGAFASCGEMATPKTSRSSTITEESRQWQKQKTRPNPTRRNSCRGIHEAQQHQPKSARARHRREPRPHQRYRARAIEHHGFDCAQACEIFWHD